MGVIHDYGFPFLSIEGDRQYSSSEWREYFEGLVTSGVILDVEGDLKVKPRVIPEKQVIISKGAILIKGAMRILADEITLSVDDNTSGSPRVDRVVARLDVDSRKIEFVVKRGTANPPALTRTASVWELSIARLNLSNGYSVIDTGVIVDERMDDLAGGFAKTIYMQNFDDENNLLKYNREVKITDANGFPTEVHYKRGDNSVFLRQVMSSADGVGRYRTVTETFYRSDASAYKTVVYTFTYLASNFIATSARAVTLHG